MRKLAPYFGIALAVAIGVASAPYVGWIIAAIVVAWTFRGRVALLALLLVFGAWIAWLADREQYTDATFVAALFGILLAWPWITRGATRAWARFMAWGDPPSG